MRIISFCSLPHIQCGYLVQERIDGLVFKNVADLPASARARILRSEAQAIEDASRERAAKMTSPLCHPKRAAIEVGSSDATKLWRAWAGVLYEPLPIQLVLHLWRNGWRDASLEICGVDGDDLTTNMITIAASLRTVRRCRNADDFRVHGERAWMTLLLGLTRGPATEDNLSSSVSADCIMTQNAATLPCAFPINLTVFNVRSRARIKATRYVRLAHKFEELTLAVERRGLHTQSKLPFSGGVWLESQCPRCGFEVIEHEQWYFNESPSWLHSGLDSAYMCKCGS